MPSPRIPSLQDIIDGKVSLEEIGRLPLPWQEMILEQARSAHQAMFGGSNVPETPTLMAIENPKYKWMDARHLHFLGEEVADAVYRSKELGEMSALLVNCPPRHAKSALCSTWTPFWYLAQYPEDNILLVASEANAAAKWGGKVRRLIELYGSQYNLHLNPKKTAGYDWELNTGGGMISVGAGGTVAGKPAKLLLCDDLLKDDAQARSEIERENMWDWWETTLLQRIEPDTTTIIIGTMYHEDDIYNRILRASREGNGHPFKHISLPAKAIKDEVDPLDRPVGEGLWIDHRTSSGLVWGQSYYDRKELSVSPYVWSSVHQQRPTSESGNMVDPKWWGFYKPSELPRSFDQSCQTWDISLDAEKKTDSQHAGLALSRIGALVYLRDLFAEHCDINRVIGTMRSWNHVYPHARAKLIERATAGVALAQTLRHEIPGIIAWPPKGRQKGSKEAELDACIPSIRAKQVLLPLHADGTVPAPVQKFIDQLRQFPRGQYDDLVDAFSQGMNYLLPGLRAQASGQDDAHDSALNPIDELTPQEVHTQILHSLITRYAKSKMDAMRFHQKMEERVIVPFQKGFDTGINRGVSVASMFPRIRRGSGMW